MFMDFGTGKDWWDEPPIKPKKFVPPVGNTYRSSDIFACAARDARSVSNVNPKKYGPAVFYQIERKQVEIITPPSKMHRFGHHR